jgi:hypothetical protein
MELPRLQITTNEGKRYTSSLSGLSFVKCFPKGQQEWESVSITAGGHSLTWACRFEVHVWQVIDAKEAVQDIKLHA